MLQVINIHAFCNKFNESRDHFYVTTVGLHEAIQMQTKNPLYEQFLNILETYVEGVKHCNTCNLKRKPESTHIFSYSNTIGNWVKCMLT